MARLIGSIWFLCLLAVQAQTPPTQSPQPANLTPQDLARGKQLFEAQCAPCHGIQGTGGKGANLARPTLKHAAEAAALFAQVQDGIESTSMPGACQRTEPEVR